MDIFVVSSRQSSGKTSISICIYSIIKLFNKSVSLVNLDANRDLLTGLEAAKVEGPSESSTGVLGYVESEVADFYELSDCSDHQVGERRYRVFDVGTSELPLLTTVSSKKKCFIQVIDMRDLRRSQNPAFVLDYHKTDVSLTRASKCFVLNHFQQDLASHQRYLSSMRRHEECFSLRTLEGGGGLFVVAKALQQDLEGPAVRELKEMTIKIVENSLDD